MRSMVPLNLTFAHAHQYMYEPACLPYAKLKNLACTCTVACNVSMHMWYTGKVLNLPVLTTVFIVATLG